MPDASKPILLLTVKMWLGGDRQSEKWMAEITPSYHASEGNALASVVEQMQGKRPPKDWMILDTGEYGNQREPVSIPIIMRRMSR